MKHLWTLFDNLLIRAISLAGVQVPIGVDEIQVDCLPEYLDPESRRRRPERPLRFALP